MVTSKLVLSLLEHCFSIQVGVMHQAEADATSVNNYARANNRERIARPLASTY